MKIRLFNSLLILPLLTAMYGCGMDMKYTTLEVTDAERHYYPVKRGEVLDIVYEVHNTGKNPLFIEDVKTSCGCVLLDKSSLQILPPGRNGFIRMKYDSNKNIGYVKHYVTIYANLETGENVEFSFDLNVVPNALYTRDYEELYEKQRNISGRTLVDGDQTEKGYYTGEYPL